MSLEPEISAAEPLPSVSPETDGGSTASPYNAKSASMQAVLAAAHAEVLSAMQLAEEAVVAAVENTSAKASHR